MSKNFKNKFFPVILQTWQLKGLTTFEIYNGWTMLVLAKIRRKVSGCSYMYACSYQIRKW